MEYHVAKWGCDRNPGTCDKPFASVSRAADLAIAGDTVIVHEGEYREWVKPKNGGTKLERITYRAAAGEKVAIKGSERIRNWREKGNGVWEAKVPNSLFGSFNPFSTILAGDWLIYPIGYALHLGDVYLDGKSLYEAPSLEEVFNPSRRTEGFSPPWTGRNEAIPDPDSTLSTWHASVDDEITTITANFGNSDPNEALAEINVRPAVFLPERTGLDYITVSGFELCQAATQWAPPTAEQGGLIGPHWAKGWIIEKCDIHDSKCSAISLGKEISTGDNECTRFHRKPGYQYQMEAVFKALAKGWSKDAVGSHVIRDNLIHDNGQNGIVGHMGCIFSRICSNRIWNNGTKHEFFGYEIAAIKLHAAIDVQIHDNYIHDTTLGIWLDWQAQGARITRNVFAKNERDLFVEVSHGPYIVDNNVFCSAYFLDNIAQGGAYIGNLICGTMRRKAVPDRSTPYHYAHTTAVAGSAIVWSGDERIFNNIYIGKRTGQKKGFTYGTVDYSGHPSSIEEYVSKVESLGNGDLEMFAQVPQPAYISGNAYYNGALPYDRETDNLVSDEDPGVEITEEDGRLFLTFEAGDDLVSMKTEIVATEDLAVPRITECCYENPDGTPIAFDTDINGEKRTASGPPGPFANLHKGTNRIELLPELPRKR